MREGVSGEVSRAAAATAHSQEINLKALKYGDKTHCGISIAVSARRDQIKIPHS